jgi:hypothetical protein
MIAAKYCCNTGSKCLSQYFCMFHILPRAVPAPITRKWRKKLFRHKQVFVNNYHIFGFVQSLRCTTASSVYVGDYFAQVLLLTVENNAIFK